MTATDQVRQEERAAEFARLHQPGSPLILYNIWDAGTAKAVADAGAAAVATGSWSVAAAHGYDDGELIPLDLVEIVASRIAASVDCPLTVDFEGGYSKDPKDVAVNAERILRTGAVGVNFEDGKIRETGLYPIEVQCKRIAALRRAGSDAGVHLFINARTDLFLQSEQGRHETLVPAALDRAEAYREAGADCLFVPGLLAPELIASICEHATLPVNVMMMAGAPALDRLASLGVSRISYGPQPFQWAMDDLSNRYRSAMSGA